MNLIDWIMSLVGRSKPREDSEPQIYLIEYIPPHPPSSSRIVSFDSEDEDGL